MLITSATHRGGTSLPGAAPSSLLAMKIALPLTSSDQFSAHYGAAAKFAVFDVDPKKRTVIRRVVIVPQDSEPCGWPPLLRAAGADLVLAGGMGRGAQLRMAEHGVKVLAGVPAAAPEALIAGWLAGTLTHGENACDGGHHEGEAGCHGHTHAHDSHGHDHESGCGCPH